MSVRLDLWLVTNGVFGGRDTAKKHIEAGEVLVNGKVVTKPSYSVDDADAVICNGAERFVGRGGYKLEEALRVSKADISGAVALDVGASTGGFTDCMLQYGARKVYAVDVGHGQLHPSLRDHPSVISMEETDIRMAADRITDHPSFCSVDVSFISLKQVLPSVLPILSEHAMLVCLIKPQFEAGRSAVKHGGIVKDPADHIAVLRDLCHFFGEQNCGIRHLIVSPIQGGDGNTEYLAVLDKNKTGILPDVPALVKEIFPKGVRPCR